MVALGTHSHVIPSVVHLRADGTLITGEAAVRRSLSDPGRTAREFKRRLGDPTPILLGGTPLAAVDLMTALLRDVLAAVSERHGGPPSAVALTHPANWGQFKIDLLRQAADACGLRDVTLVTEPVAAAVDYAAGARVPVGEVVAVYDLGGGTFDAAVLRRTASGFETLGEPVGLERLGGIDFDHAVVAHVERSIADTLQAMDRNDPEVAGALARLRHECVTAKEGLSEDSEVVVPVALPGLWSEVRLTRGEFEQMIAPALVEPLRAFRHGVASAGISASDIHTVLLVGGSSRVPLVAETVAGELGRPVAVDTHPKHAVALGRGAHRRHQGALRQARRGGHACRHGDACRHGGACDPTAEASSNACGGSDRVAPPAPARPSMAFAAVAAVAVIGAGVAAFVTLGGSQGSASEVETPDAPATTSSVQAEEHPVQNIEHDQPSIEPDPTIPTTEHAPPADLCGSASGLCAFITDIRLDGDRYIVDYATAGFDPLIHGEDEGASEHDHHVHFFFDTTDAGNAGTNGQPPGSWEVWGLQRGGGELVFDDFTVDDAGDAEQPVRRRCNVAPRDPGRRRAHRKLRRPSAVTTSRQQDDMTIASTMTTPPATTSDEPGEAPPFDRSSPTPARSPIGIADGGAIGAALERALAAGRRGSRSAVRPVRDARG